MKTMQIMIGLMLALTFNGPAMADDIGGVDGGGGIGVRCPGASGGDTKTFEILDFHEARLHGLKPGASAFSAIAAADLAARLLANLIWTPALTGQSRPDMRIEFMQEFRAVLSGQDGAVLFKIKHVPSLPLSSDVGNYQISPGCALEQIAYFDDKTNLLSLADNWKDLDFRNQAGLLTHEFAYLIDRHYGMEYLGTPGMMTSQRAREFVGKLYSEDGLTPHSDSIPMVGYANCALQSTGGGWPTDVTKFYAFDDKAGNLLAVFDIIHSRGSMFQMKAKFPGITLKEVLQHRGKTLQFSGPLQFVDESETTSFVLQFTSIGDRPDLNFQVFENMTGGLAPIEANQTITCLPNL